MEIKNKNIKISSFVPAAAFLLFIFGMGLWFLLTPKREYSPSEKRYLQKFPEVSFESVANGEFGENFESYFADHFPLRTMWVGLNSYYNLAIGNNGANGVYNCSDGYLINAPVSTENQIEKNINTIIDFKSAIKAPVSVITVPSTGYICNDVLPAVHNRYNDDEYFTQISEKLEKNSINFIDLRDRFKKAYAGGTELYYKTDHHWTVDGAYEAYTELCKNLNITPAEKNSFKTEEYDNFYGTTYSTSGFWLTAPDKIKLLAKEHKGLTVEITEGNETNKYNSMYFKKHLEEDDKYPVFLDGNHAYTEIVNPDAKNGTIVLVKDSFAHCFAPLLTENYSKVILVDMRYYKESVSEIVKKENPEQVLFLYGIDNLATDTSLPWLE